jgi:hypothetical protein
VAEPLQRERDLAQLGLHIVPRCAKALGELGRRRPELLDDVGDAHLGAVMAAIRLLERRGQPDRLGLAERPPEHRACDGLQQPLAQLSPADPGERVQPGAPARRESEDRAPERVDERVVFALEVHDLAPAPEHAGAHQPSLREAGLAEVGAADDERVRVVQDAAGVQDPRVVDEAAAVHVAADVDPPRAEPGLGDGRVHRLKVRGGHLVSGALPREAASPEPPDRAPGVVPAEPACPLTALGLGRPVRPCLHLSPRQRGRPNVKASACCPHIRSSRSGAAFA